MMTFTLLSLCAAAAQARANNSFIDILQDDDVDGRGKLIFLLDNSASQKQIRGYER